MSPSLGTDTATTDTRQGRTRSGDCLLSTLAEVVGHVRVFKGLRHLARQVDEAAGDAQLLGHLLSMELAWVTMRLAFSGEHLLLPSCQHGSIRASNRTVECPSIAKIASLEELVSYRFDAATLTCARRRNWLIRAIV